MTTSTSSAMGVPAAVVTRLDADGTTAPLPIQSAVILDALAGNDVIERAPTGAGGDRDVSVHSWNLATAVRRGRRVRFEVRQGPRRRRGPRHLTAPPHNSPIPVPDDRPKAGPIRKQAAMKGTIKFFSDERGFGFIARDGGNDVFVHRSNVVGEANATLESGQVVEFEIGVGRKGDEAINVRTA